MKVTLRKANAIQNSINDAIKNIKVEFNVTLNEFQNPEAEIDKANLKFAENDLRRTNLLIALYNIRGLVCAANAQSGIDLKLTKAAFIDKRIAQLAEMVGKDTVIDLEVVKGKLEKIKSLKDEARSRIYGYGDTVETSVLRLGDIERYRAQLNDLRKQKQSINDEVLELNIKTEIPLSDDVVATLTLEGLI